MIKVLKDLSVIPESLNNKKTNRKRDNCLKDGKYHYKKAFDQQYKQQDTKDILKSIYYEKCAFCEQVIRECKDNNLEDFSSTVEHYRPKSKYYWLAYSWDNLLWCCLKCNESKKNNFEFLGNEVSYENEIKEKFKENIHSSTQAYNDDEKPKMIHPEIESVLDKLSFYDGVIKSEDARVAYTIKTCAIDRDALNDKRKTLIDDYIDILIEKETNNESLSGVKKKIFNDFKDEENEFRALRYWLLKNYLSIIKGKTMKQTFKVVNVKCGGCASTLKKSLAKEFGEIEVNLNVEPRQITLSIDEENIPSLRLSLKKLGYPMSDEDLSTIEGFSTTAKSFVSCAVGKINNK